MEVITTPSPRALSRARENDSCPDISSSASYRTIARSRTALGSRLPDATLPAVRAAHSSAALVTRLLAVRASTTLNAATAMLSPGNATVVTERTIAVTQSFAPGLPGLRHVPSAA